MSFILDALKKSESERQRQSGPALFEVKIAPPRSRIAVWGAAIAALLVINFAVVGFWLWRGSASRAAAPAATAATAASPASPASPSSPASPMPAQTAALAGNPQPVSAGARFGARAEAGGVPSAASPPTAPTTSAASPAASPAAPPAVAAPTAGSLARAGAGEPGANPDDFAPAVEPRAKPAQPVAGVIRATASGLPTYQDAAAEPGANIPNLSLDLHVYSPQPDQRFVFLNMLKLREGDTSPQGVHVERITPDGAILSYQGKEFVLQRH